jgi:phosphoribosylglycinamide formyltransferase-1
MIRKRTAILISGRGSNMTALVEAARNADYPAEIVGVFSNRADAPGLQYAWLAGIPTAVRSHKDFASREAFDTEIGNILASWGAELVCLAGYMRIFSAPFAQQWAGRMLNIHPSLLPLFKDDGPTILQRRVPVVPGDTAEALAARILVEEHTAYPEALAMVARGEVSLR